MFNHEVSKSIPILNFGVVSTMLTLYGCDASIYTVDTMELEEHMQDVEIQKWGNSAAIRLNKALLKQVSSDIGSKFEVILKDGGLFLKPVKEPSYDLEELLQTCTKENTRLDEEDQAWLNARPRGEEFK